LPEAQPGEGAFAASNSCIAILHSQSTQNASVQDVPVNPVILSGAVAQAQREQLRSRRIPTPSTSFGPHYAPFPEGEEDWAENAPSTTVEERRFSAASAAEEKGASAPNPNIWFATGGRAARVFHSPDRGQTWQVFDTPIVHGPDSAGIFSIAFLDATHGVIAGGDYKHPDQDGPNLAFTTDGGKTWTLSQIYPQSYYSAVAYDRKSNKTETQSRIFLIGPKFIYDFRPPKNPTRVSPPKKSGIQFNAASPYPEGGVLVVGPKGSTASIP